MTSGVARGQGESRLAGRLEKGNGLDPIDSEDHRASLSIIDAEGRDATHLGRAGLQLLSPAGDPEFARVFVGEGQSPRSSRRCII